MAKPYKRKSNEEKEKEVNELIEKANVGIENSFTTPENLKELLNYMSKFYNYSLRNASLIQEQFRGALAVGSYAFWKEKGFTVNKGEKGIKILVPNRLSDYFINAKGEEVKLKDATREEKKLIEQGEIEVRKGKLIFNQGYVFEVSQTNAKVEDLPKIFPNRWLEGEVKDYDLMYKAMENIAKKIGVKIIEPKDELGAVKGVSYPVTKEVALNPRNTQLQNVKTLIHELTHAKLHTMETRDNYTTNAKEFQAEMAAYVVCSYFGLDTSEYSFRYISSWTKDVELKDKEKLINEVRETVKEYIDVIEKTLINDKELSLSLEKKNSLEKKENIEYDKNLYEIKEQEVMNNNSIKDIFKNLKEKVMIKVNFILGKEKEEVDIEKELREFEELFLEAEDSMEIEPINESIQIIIDGIVLETFMENGIEEEKLLKLKDDLIKLYEREIPEKDKKFMQKRGLELDKFIEDFEKRLKDIDFQEEYYYMSFKDYLEEELIGYSETECEEFDEETYMDRLERQQIGEEEYIKIYGKNNPIDTYMYYYERAYISYENIDKDKIYTIKMDMKVKGMELKEGEEFKISGYNQGKFIIEFTNKEEKESITFNELQGLSDLLKKDIDNIIELERYFNKNNIDEELRKELHQNKDFINLLDEKREIDITIRNLKEDIEYYSDDDEYSIDDLKSKLETYEKLSLVNSKELNRLIGYEIEEIKEEKKWLNKYFDDKEINQELREELIANKKFVDLANAKVDLEMEYSEVYEEIQHYDEEISTPIEILEKKLEVNNYLQSFVNKEINKIVGYELEEDNYIEREFITIKDIKLKDGSFIEKGTSFFITDVIEDEGIPLYKADLKGIEETKYFYDIHLAECSNLSEVKELTNQVEEERENDNWKLTEKEIAEAERLVELEEVKEKIEKLMKENYGDFIRAIISIEAGIEDIELLDNIYEEYMDKDFKFINDKFEELKNELGKEKLDMRDEKKEKEIWRKIREHEEWVKSNGLRGQKLNLENENLKGMRLINLDLREANFKGADMTQCIVYADLRGADLTGAKIDNSEWIGSNINNVTIEANKLNLIEYQMEQEKELHLSSMDKLKTKEKEKEMNM